MSLDHSGDFDARRAGWWQRRSALGAIRRATGLADADRDLRLRSAKAAQNRGELNALTRGLTGAADRPATSLPPPLVPVPPVPPVAPRTTATARRPRSVGRTVIGAVVVGVFLCGASLVSCVSSVVSSVSDVTTGSESSPEDLHTAQAWSRMVEELAATADVDRSVELVVTPRSATLSVAHGTEGAVQQYYYDGDVTLAEPVVSLAGRRELDLADIDPDVVEDVVARARREAGVAASSRPFVTVHDQGEGPRIVVSFPDELDQVYELVVDLDGIAVD